MARLFCSAMRCASSVCSPFVLEEGNRCVPINKAIRCCGFTKVTLAHEPIQLLTIDYADFDGDGRPDVAYVETPHLGKVLRVWTLEEGKLVEIAAAGGVTNHRIGEEFITGGVRNCGDGPEMVMADANWTSVVSVRLADGELRAQVLGKFSRQAVARAMACG